MLRLIGLLAVVVARGQSQAYMEEEVEMCVHENHGIICTDQLKGLLSLEVWPPAVRAVQLRRQGRNLRTETLQAGQQGKSVIQGLVLSWDV